MKVQAEYNSLQHHFDDPFVVTLCRGPAAGKAGLFTIDDSCGRRDNSRQLVPTHE